MRKSCLREMIYGVGLVAVLLASGCGETPQSTDEVSTPNRVPQYAVDPSWPKPLMLARIMRGLIWEITS